MFSPAEGKIIGTLQGVHERGIKDFKFSHPDHTEGWSIGGDGKLVQWDLIEGRAIRTIALPDPAISILASPSQRAPRMLCASSTPFAIDLKSPEDFHIDRYDAFKNAVHALVRSDFGDSTTSEHFLAADTDRYINVYDMSLKRLVRTLVAGSGAMQIDFTTPAQNTRDVLDRQMLAVVTKDGSVELFAHPFVQAKQVNGDLKSNRKNLTTKASAQVRLINPDHKSKHVAILAASLQGPDLLIASADSGVDLAFQKVRWQDEGNGELLFDGTKEVVKVRGASTLNTANLNGAKDMGKSHVDESRTVVVNGGLGGPHSDAIEISSSEDEAGESADDEDDNVKEESDEEPSEAESDEEMVDADNDDKSDKNALDEDLEEGPTEEPTFGEQLAAKHPGTISIIDAFKPEESAITFNDNRPTIPSGMSLGTVLTQSLRTNDNNLLEACLHTLDISIVKTTIQRLDSSLAGILLSKLAERLATRPGRYGHLITWVQWTCIAHGGAIAAQPDVAAKVRTLYQVLSQRSKTLDSLLLLKGKLDMLEAQLSYRKQLAAQRAVQGNDAEPGMIYIEGADNWESR
jgi:U3 small nucleolar RNA-associated protein 5